MDYAEKLAPYAAAKDHFMAHPHLKYLFFELTDQCNLHCRHCGSSCPTRSCHSRADIRDLKRVVDEVTAHTRRGDVMFCVTGGEPLLWDAWDELGAYITQKGYPWGMTTNGTLITPEIIERMKRSGMKTISVSLDGLCATHEWLRDAPGCFDRAVNGIRLLADSGNFRCVQVTTVVNPKNIDELEELYHFLPRLGVQSWKLTGVEPIGDASKNQELFLSGSQYRRLLDFIADKRLGGDMAVSYGCSHFLPECYEQTVRTARFHCGSGVFVASISAQGDILGCLDIDERELTRQGNIRTDSFWDVWTNRFTIFRRMRQLNNGVCDGCRYQHYCRGDSWHTWDFQTGTPRLCLFHHLDEKE